MIVMTTNEFFSILIVNILILTQFVYFRLMDEEDWLTIIKQSENEN